MNRPEDFATVSLSKFFDTGVISVEQLNEYVRRLRKELEDIFVPAIKIGDQLSVCESELATLRAELDKCKTQKPVQWVCHDRHNPWPNGGGKRFDDKAAAIHHVETTQYGYNHVMPIYLEPVPPQQVPYNTALIPILRGEPEITNRMKAECIGEFNFKIEVPELNDEFEVTGEMEDREVDVPWDLCKTIYKAMAKVAMLSPTPPSDEAK